MRKNDKVVPARMVKRRECETGINLFKLQEFTGRSYVEGFFDEMSIKLDDFRLIWLSHGNGRIQVDTQWHGVSGSSVCCLAPGSVCRLQLSPESKGVAIAFSPAFIQGDRNSSVGFSWCAQYERFLNSPLIPVPAENRSGMKQIVSQLTCEMQTNGMSRPDIIRSLLNVFVIYFSRELSTVPENYASRDRELLRRFMALLRENFISRKMVCDYAEKLLVTPNHLNRAIKRLTGQTASYHIQQQIILEAKRRALCSGYSMKEVAYALGFEDLAHFSKFFKNNCGIRFSDFRKNQLEVT